jgi:hypothetical protein
MGLGPVAALAEVSERVLERGGLIAGKASPVA